MTQFQCIDARFDTLSIELYQVNIRVSHIALRQAVIGGLTLEASPPPPPTASEDDVDDATTSEDDDDGDASSSGTDEMST